MKWAEFVLPGIDGVIYTTCRVKTGTAMKVWVNIEVARQFANEPETEQVFLSVVREEIMLIDEHPLKHGSYNERFITDIWTE